MCLRRAKTLYILISAVLCVCTTAQNTTKADLGKPCQTENDCVSGATCTGGQCVCKEHIACARKDPKQICLQTSQETICASIACVSQGNCTALTGTKCDFVDGVKYCIVASGDSNAGEGGGGEIGSLNSILKLGVVIVGGSIFLTTICLLCVITGKCSGEPGTTPVKDRGVEYLKVRIPRGLGGTKPPKSAAGKPPTESASVAGAASNKSLTTQSMSGQPGVGNLIARPPSDSALSEATASEVSSVATESVVSAASGASEASTKA